MSLAALAFALALAGGPADPSPPQAARGRAASVTDEEVIRNLELLERLELLRKLELFDAAGDDEAKPPPPPHAPEPPPGPAPTSR